MKRVGLRELKNHLSKYIRRVRSGHKILVTDRGQVVAELTPPGESPDERGLPPGLLALAREGKVTLGLPNDPALYTLLPRALRGISSQELLDEDRGPR